MDITPSIPNPNCRFGGELVPDKTLKMWNASNPKGYRQLFEERAKLAAVIRLRKHVALDSARASVEPYPEAGGFKGILRRTAQIAKRHRDIMFVDEPDVAPLSVIITTLVSRGYEWCVTNREYDSEFELLFDVIRSSGTKPPPARTSPRSGIAGRSAPKRSTLGMIASAPTWRNSKPSADSTAWAAS